MSTRKKDQKETTPPARLTPEELREAHIKALKEAATYLREKCPLSPEEEKRVQQLLSGGITATILPPRKKKPDPGAKE